MSGVEGKEKEVYIDFSKEEEVVPAEVQSTETREATLFDKIASKLPSSMRDSFEQLVESYNQHRKYYLIGIAVAIIIVVIVAAVGILLLWDKNSGPDFSYSGTPFPGTPIPLTLDPGMNTFNVSVERPPGALSLRKVSIQLLDQKNQTIPSYTVFIHHMFLLNQDTSVVAACAAEGQVDPAVNLPNPYVISVSSADTWHLVAELNNLWGSAANAQLDVQVVVSIVYTDPDPTDSSVGWRYVGSLIPQSTIGNSQITLPSNPDPWPFTNSTLVLVSGHMHIGGTSMILVDSTSNETIATVVPEYDLTTGYITSIPLVYPDNYVIQPGATLQLIATYVDTPEFTDVTNIFQLWGTFPQQSLLPDSSPAPAPSSSTSPSPPSVISSDTSPSVTSSGTASPTVSPSVSASRNTTTSAQKKNF